MNLRILIILAILMIHNVILAQEFHGRVFSLETKLPVPYVNIGIISKNAGTVSDEAGWFSFKAGLISGGDSIRFSMIGFDSRTLSAGQFIKDSIRETFLVPRSYDLKEAEVVYLRSKEIMIGCPVAPNNSTSGFAYNDLGSEMGILVLVKHKAQVMDIHLDVAECTFDSVVYRLNIYSLTQQEKMQNILSEPIYLTFNKKQAGEAIGFDLRRYSLVLQGTYLITLELFRDLGEGSLQFWNDDRQGETWFRKTCEGKWGKCPGSIGMYMNGILLK